MSFHVSECLLFLFIFIYFSVFFCIFLNFFCNFSVFNLIYPDFSWFFFNVFAIFSQRGRSLNILAFFLIFLGFFALNFAKLLYMAGPYIGTLSAPHVHARRSRTTTQPLRGWQLLKADEQSRPSAISAISQSGCTAQTLGPDRHDLLKADAPISWVQTPARSAWSSAKLPFGPAAWSVCCPGT